jgi:hypothetical protein
MLCSGILCYPEMSMYVTTLAIYMTSRWWLGGGYECGAGGGRVGGRWEGGMGVGQEGE